MAASAIKRQREEPINGVCLALSCGEACQLAQPRRSKCPQRWALLPSDAGAMNMLLHQGAPVWKERRGLAEAKQVRRGAS